MIDWSKVQTPGAGNRGTSSDVTTTTPVPASPDMGSMSAPPVAPITIKPTSGPAPIGTTSDAGYTPGEGGWKPISQETEDALDPAARVHRGIDYLGYLLFGNKPGEDQYGHDAPLKDFQNVRNAMETYGDLAAGVANFQVVKPFEIVGTALSHVPLGWISGSDEKFEMIGSWAEKNSPEIYNYWQQTKAKAEADVLGGGNLKADFNIEVATLLDDQMYDSQLGTTPLKALGGEAVGSLGGALSNAIQGVLGVGSNQIQLLTGQAGWWDPGRNTASFEDQFGKWQAVQNGTEYRSENTHHSIGIGDEQSVVFQQWVDGKITEDEARAAVAKFSAGGRTRLEEAMSRANMGLETSEVEQRAVAAYMTGAWSQQHAEEWIVSHGQGFTRNPVGQIAGTVATDPLTWASLGTGAVASAGAAGVRIASVANVINTTSKGASIAERIGAGVGNAARISRLAVAAENPYEKVALGIAAAQKSPAGPLLRAARGVVDPFAVYKPSPVLKATIEMRNEMVADALQRTYGPSNYASQRGLAREVGMVDEFDKAAANYVADQADGMTAGWAQRDMYQTHGERMMNPEDELSQVDPIAKGISHNVGTSDGVTMAVDHMQRTMKNTFTEGENITLANRMAATLGGGKDWKALVAKMGTDAKSLWHAVTYKLADTGFFKAMNEVDVTAYAGDLPLHRATLMENGTLDDILAKDIIDELDSILADETRPDRIEAATNLWNGYTRDHRWMAEMGTATGGEKQVKDLLREFKGDYEKGAFPKRARDTELSDPALKPLSDFLDSQSVPMTQEEIAAAREAARKTATISHARQAGVEARRAELVREVRSMETRSGRVKGGMKAEHDAAKARLDAFMEKHPPVHGTTPVDPATLAEAERLSKARVVPFFDKTSKTWLVRTVDENGVEIASVTAKSAAEKTSAVAEAEIAIREAGDLVERGGVPIMPTLEEKVSAAEAGAPTVHRLWNIGFRPDETVAWGLKRDVNTGAPRIMREPSITHNFDAVPGRQPSSDVVRNVLGQIIGTKAAAVGAKPVEQLETFINTAKDMVTGQRLVYNMEQRFERTMFDAGVPRSVYKMIFKRARETAALDQTTIRGIKPANLWKAIADDIPRDLRLADGSTLNVHVVMDHLLVAAEGDLRIMGLTSKLSQRMRNILRQRGIDPQNWMGQMTITMYNRLRYAQPTFLIQRIADSVYYSILGGIMPVGRGALSETNAALARITNNMAKTATARDFAFDLPEYATHTNFNAGIRTALQEKGITESLLNKIATAPDVMIEHNMVNMLQHRLGDVMKGVLKSMEKAALNNPELAAEMADQTSILSRSMEDWRRIYSQNAGRVLNDNEVGLRYLQDMMSGWRRIEHNVDGTLNFNRLVHEGTMMMPSDVASMESIQPDLLAREVGAGYESAEELRRDVGGTMEKINGQFQHVAGEHDLPWLREILTNKIGAHPDYVKRAMAYFGDTWDNFWYRMSLPIDKGGLDISEHYAKEAQSLIGRLAQERGMDPWEYLSGVMLINSGADSLDTAIGRFITFLKKGEVSAEPSDWGVFFRSHLDPSAQTTLQDAWSKAQSVQQARTQFAQKGDRIIVTEADGRQIQYNVMSVDPASGTVHLSTNPDPKAIGRLKTMTNREWQIANGTPEVIAASTPPDVPIQPPSGFTADAGEFIVGHDHIPSDYANDGIFHVTTGRDGVMNEGFVPGKGKGFGKGNDTGSEGMVSTVTSQARATTYEDRMRLAVRAARGEASPEEIGDYFIPLYQKAYGSDWVNRMGAAGEVLDKDVLTPEEAWGLVKRLDEMLFGGPNGRTPGGAATGLTSAESAVNLVGKFEEYAAIDPDQIALLRLSAKQGTAAKRGLDTGELLFNPDEVTPLNAIGDSNPVMTPEQATAAQAQYSEDLMAFEKGAIDHADRVKRTVAEQTAWDNHQKALARHAEDMKAYDAEVKRIQEKFAADKAAYDEAVANGPDAVATAKFAEDKAAYDKAFEDWRKQVEDIKAKHADEVKAYEDALAAHEDAAAGGDIPEPVQKVVDKFSARKDSGHMERELDKLDAAGYDTNQARDSLDEYKNIQRNDYESGEYGTDDYNTARQEAWDKVLEDLQTDNPLDNFAPEEPLPPTFPEPPVAPVEPTLGAAPEPPVMEALPDPPVRPMTPDEAASKAAMKDYEARKAAHDAAEKARFDAESKVWQDATDDYEAGWAASRRSKTGDLDAAEERYNNAHPDASERTMFSAGWADQSAENAKYTTLHREVPSPKPVKPFAEAAPEAAAPKEWVRPSDVPPFDMKMPKRPPMKAHAPSEAAAAPTLGSADFAKFSAETPRSAPGRPARPPVAKLPSVFKHEEGYVYRVETPDVMEMGLPNNTGVTTGSPTPFYEGKDGVQKAIFRVKDDGNMLATGRHGEGGADRLTTRDIAPEEIEMLMADGTWKPIPDALAESAPDPTLGLNQTPPGPEVNDEFWDTGIIEMAKARITSGPHPNPDVEAALQQVAKLVGMTLKGGETAKNTRNIMRDLVKAVPTKNAVPYNRSQVLVHQLLKAKIEEAQRDIFRLAEMQTQRSVLERSINHPLFGIYPASYMWGKVFPESVKFLARNPYASTYVIADVQRAIAMQREFDPEFDSKMASVDRSSGSFLADYLTPSLPWSDHSSRMSPMVRDLFKGQPENIWPDELATVSPERWVSLIGRTIGEVPGAIGEITGANKPPERAVNPLTVTMPSALPVEGSGGTTESQISGLTKAAALAPILQDDLSRLQSILLGGQDAAE
jgi:hypothetical protein